MRKHPLFSHSLELTSQTHSSPLFPVCKMSKKGEAREEGAYRICLHGKLGGNMGPRRVTKGGNCQIKPQIYNRGIYNIFNTRSYDLNINCDFYRRTLFFIFSHPSSNQKKKEI